MKTTQALNFFLVGSVMCFSPAYWPDYFSSGMNTSELWLMVMGITQMVMGVWTMAVNEVPRFLQAVTQWEPVTLKFELADVRWALPESFYVGLRTEEDVNVALSLQQQLRLRAAA